MNPTIILQDTSEELPGSIGMEEIESILCFIYISLIVEDGILT